MEPLAPLSPAQAVRRNCAVAFDVPETKLLGRGRARWISIPRQATCYVLRQRFPHLSYPSIAKLIGGRDHSTIIHAVRQTEARMERDAALARKINALIAGPIDRKAHDAHVLDWVSHKAKKPKSASVFTAMIDEEGELAEFVQAEKIWCDQCDRSVHPQQARRCGARLCSLRAAESIAA
jgi:hypothetical protein